MDFEKLVKEISEMIQREGNVRAVFGEPITLDTHKLVPVARCSLNVGGGIGSGDGIGPGKDGDRTAHALGGGGGINIVISPLGFLQEVEGRVTYTPIVQECKHAGTWQGLWQLLQPRVWPQRKL